MGFEHVESTIFRLGIDYNMPVTLKTRIDSDLRFLLQSNDEIF